MKLKVRHIGHKVRGIKARKIFDNLDRLRLACGRYITEEEVQSYLVILGDVELCRQIKLNLPRSIKMQRYLDKVKGTN